MVARLSKRLSEVKQSSERSRRCRRSAARDGENSHRLGRYSINAVRIAGILQECGIAALAVHGRTRAQGYSGEADWRVIGEVADAVTIPVIGNGDLFCAAEVARRRAETKIAAS